MNRLQIKPLSVNRAWQGKRFKTKEYVLYGRQVPLFLPKLEIPSGKLFIKYIFGVSTNNADYDNPVKPLQDIIAKHYNFNDSRIFGGITLKTIVPKGQEFIKFEIVSFENNEFSFYINQVLK